MNVIDDEEYNLDEQLEGDMDYLTTNPENLRGRDYIGYVVIVEEGGKGNITRYYVTNKNYNDLPDEQLNMMTEYFDNYPTDEYIHITEDQYREQQLDRRGRIFSYTLHPRYHLDRQRLSDEMEPDDEMIPDEEIGKIAKFKNAETHLKALTYKQGVIIFLKSIQFPQSYEMTENDKAFNKVVEQMINNVPDNISKDNIDAFLGQNLRDTYPTVYFNLKPNVSATIDGINREEVDLFLGDYLGEIQDLGMTHDLSLYVNSRNREIANIYTSSELIEQIKTSGMGNRMFSYSQKSAILDKLISHNMILFVDPRVAKAHTRRLTEQKFTTSFTTGGPSLMTEEVNGKRYLMPSTDEKHNDNISAILYQDLDSKNVYRINTKKNSFSMLLIKQCFNASNIAFNSQLLENKIHIIGYVLEPCSKQLMGFTGCKESSTSYQTGKAQKGVYSGFECKEDPLIVKRDPLEHQQLIREHLINNRLKRLLLFHKLGSGKTCTAIFIADELLRTKKITRVFVFCTSTLRTSWVQEYCEKCGVNSRTLNKYYTFITLIYPSQITDLIFTDSLVIIDEVHLLLSTVRNGSNTGINIYERILNAAEYIILLSGTPIGSCSTVKAQVEYYLLMRLLDTQSKNPEQVEYILKMCKEDKLDTVKYTDGIIGVYNEGTTDGKRVLDASVSYFDVDAADPDFKKDEFLVLCRASNIQREEIKASINREHHLIFGDFRNKPNPPSKATRTLARMRKMSRRDSNYFDAFVYEDEVIKNLQHEIITLGNEGVDVSSLQRELQTLIKRKGQPIPSSFDDLKVCSMKYTALLNQIYIAASSPGGRGRKHLIYTSFLHSHGAFFLKQLIDYWIKDRGNGTEHVSTLVFHGSLNSEQKQELINNFNKIENPEGITKIIIVTDAGAIGINLLRTNYLHIIDSHFSEPKLQQVIGRIIRYNSHEGMPKEDQYVRIYRYITYYTDIEQLEDGYRTIPTSSYLVDSLKILKGIDIKLYIDGKKCLELTEKYHNMMKTNNIEKGLSK